MTRLRSGAPGRERGSATLELTIVFPALLLVMTGIVQAGLWFYAREVALAAAEEGARAASVEHASADDGTRTAQHFIDRTANNLVHQVQVTAQRTTARASVTVTGHSLSLVPGVEGFTISQTATYEVERITR
jgi:Flp pilus assembly protein TadG